MKKNWKLLVRHNKNELLEDFQIFKNKIVLETRKNGLPQLAIIDRNNNRKTYIKFKDSTYAANLASNPNYNSNSFKYVYSSLTTPSTIYSQSFSSDNKKKVWQQKFNNFEEKNYKTMRLWIKARDGQKIPVSLIYRKGVNLKSAPLLNVWLWFLWINR